MRHLRDLFQAVVESQPMFCHLRDMRWLVSRRHAVVLEIFPGCCSALPTQRSSLGDFMTSCCQSTTHAVISEAFPRLMGIMACAAVSHHDTNLEVSTGSWPQHGNVLPSQSFGCCRSLWLHAAQGVPTTRLAVAQCGIELPSWDCL